MNNTESPDHVYDVDVGCMTCGRLIATVTLKHSTDPITERVSRCKVCNGAPVRTETSIRRLADGVARGWIDEFQDDLPRRGRRTKAAIAAAHEALAREMALAETERAS